MKKTMMWFLAGMMLANMGVAQELRPLRGGSVVDPDLPPGTYRIIEGTPLPRDFVQQPPLVPHKVEGYEVSLNFNKCLECHAWDTAARHRAPRISITHFRDREGTELANISPSRYFCNQCHVPQVDAKPLVENEFTPVQGRR